MQSKQIDLNIQESKSNSVFVAGWRPFVGWVCGFALMYNYILRNIIEYLLAVFSPNTLFPPHLSMSELLTLLTGILGFGYLRSKEKKEGTSK